MNLITQIEQKQSSFIAQNISPVTNWQGFYFFFFEELVSKRIIF